MPDASDARSEALAYLRAHNTLSLATVGSDGPWASAVFYANRGFSLYFLSEPSTRHGANLAKRADVAGTINEDYGDWREIKGVQLEGACKPVAGKVEQAAALAAYVRKFPFVASFLKPDQLLEGMEISGRPLNVRLYKLIPRRFFFLDNARGFSHRVEVPLS